MTEKTEKNLESVFEHLNDLDNKIKDVICDANKLVTWGKQMRTRITGLTLSINESDTEAEVKSKEETNASADVLPFVYTKIMSAIGIILKSTWADQRKLVPGYSTDFFMVSVKSVNRIVSLNPFQDELKKMAMDNNIPYIFIVNIGAIKYYAFKEEDLKVKVEEAYALCRNRPR